MEEQTLSAALEALRKGQCIIIMDSKSKEAKIDLFFLAIYFFPISLRTLRAKAGSEMYISIAHEVACTFGFPFIGEVSITHLELFFFFYFQ
jgi:3,4-dihydroxy-2-butanone 4-phosphate synthase